MFSTSQPEVLILVLLMFFIFAAALSLGDYAVLLVALFFAYLYLSDSTVESLVQAAWKKAQALSAKLFVLPVENLLLALAALAIVVVAFRLFAWFYWFYHAVSDSDYTCEEEYRYQHQSRQQEYHREYSREEPQEQDDYGVLGLKRGASIAEVKAAYRRLAKKHHPDAGGDPEVFKRVHTAYQNIVMGR